MNTEKTKLDRISEQLGENHGDIWAEKPYDKYVVELHTSYGTYTRCDALAESIGVDLYLYDNNAEDEDEECAVCWSALKIFFNEDFTDFEPIFLPELDNSYQYANEIPDAKILKTLRELMYQPKFIRFVNEMSRELATKIHKQISEL